MRESHKCQQRKSLGPIFSRKIILVSDFKAGRIEGSTKSISQTMETSGTQIDQ